MSWMTLDRLKYLVAAVCGLYLVLFIGHSLHVRLERVEVDPERGVLATHEPVQEIFMMDRARDLQARLGLSNEQTKQVAEILYAYGPEPTDASTDPSLSPVERFEASRNRRRALAEQIRNVLTPEQQRHFDVFRREYMAGPGGIGMQPPMGYMMPPGFPPGLAASPGVPGVPGESPAPIGQERWETLRDHIDGSRGPRPGPPPPVSTTPVGGDIEG